MKTPIFTTGLTGLVGSRFRDLNIDKFDFFNMDLTTGVDITDLSTIENFMNNNEARTLIHFAGYTNVSEAHKQDGDKSGPCYQVNVVGTDNIVSLAKERDIYLIHISTDFVFSGDKEEPYTERDEKNPIEWYGETKAMAEDIVEGKLNDYSIIRITYPFRARYDIKPDLLKRTIDGIRSGSLPPQFTDTSMTPTFIDEIATAIHEVILTKPLGIYHAVGSSFVSPYEFAIKVAQVFELDDSSIRKGSISDYMKALERPFHKHLNTSNKKIKEELGVSFSQIDNALEIARNQLLL